MKTALLVLGLATLTAARAASQGTPITVSGTVTDATSGIPLGGATVRVEARFAVVSTGPDGRFRISLGAPGTISVRRNGYSAVDRDVSTSDTSLVIALLPL